MTNVRDPDPIMAKAALSAIVTREHKLENMVRVFMRASEAMIAAETANPPSAAKLIVALDILQGAIDAANLLLNPPDPPQAA